MFNFFLKLLSIDCIDTSKFSKSNNAYKNNYGFYDLTDCFFQRITKYYDKGGVLYHFSNVYAKLEILNCIFYYCSSEVGGAIYFSSKLGYSKIEKTCGYYCSAYNMQFASISLSSDPKYYNDLTLVTISKCSDSIENPYDSIYFEGGNQTINSFNSSNNKVGTKSGISIYNPFTLKSTFWLLYNNLVFDSVCLSLFSDRGNEKFYFSNINIIKNNSPYKGIIYFLGEVIFTSSNFINNSNTLFYSNGYTYSTTLYLNNSNIIHENSLIFSYEKIYTFNNSINNDFFFTIDFNLFNTLRCFTSIPLIITPGKTQPSPSFSPSISINNLKSSNNFQLPFIFYFLIPILVIVVVATLTMNKFYLKKESELLNPLFEDIDDIVIKIN